MPVLEKKVKALNGKVILLKVNVDNCPDLASQAKVSAIPHVTLLHKGNFLDSKTKSNEF